MTGLWYLVERTKTGKAMRAVAEGQRNCFPDGNQR